MNSIYTRRSVRQYKDMPVEKEKIVQILKAGMQAPSATNQQPWEFIVVTDKDVLSKISNVSPYAKMAENSAFSIIVLCNSSNLKAPHLWQQDLGACTQNILLEATNLGLGTVWLGIAPNQERMDYISNLFNLEQNIVPFGIIVGGYPLNGNANTFVDRYIPSKIHFEQY